MTSFNFKSFLSKVANYEGVQGYAMAETRSWCNCIRAKQNDGTSAQKAWEECLKEYQTDGNKQKWVAKYLPDDSNTPKPKTASVSSVSSVASVNLPKKPVLTKTATHLAGTDMSGMTTPEVIHFMFRHDYMPKETKITDSTGTPHETLSFTDSSGTLILDPTTKKLVLQQDFAAKK